MERSAEGPPAVVPGAARRYLDLTRDPAVSLVLVLPLLVLYQVGLFFLRYRVINGADFVTRVIYPEFGLRGLVLFNLAVVAVFLAAIIRFERRKSFRPGLFVPLIAESAIYGWLLGSVILFVMRSTFLLSVGGGAPPAEARALILSIGAGVNEEIVFRLLLIGLLQYAFADFAGFTDRSALALSVLGSAILFSAAHHVGAHGEPFTTVSFVYRLLAGLIFAAIYKWRSFAVAVYTHAIYDIIVLI